MRTFGQQSSTNRGVGLLLVFYNRQLLSSSSSSGVNGGRKRKSDVAELPIPVLTNPEITSPASSPKTKRKR